MKGEEEMIQIRPVSDLRNKFPEIEIIFACSERSDEKTYLTFIGAK